MTLLLLRLGGSLAAILLVAWLVARLELGADVRLADADEARALAAQAVPGFVAQDVALDRAKVAALLRDALGRVMLLRRHGAHFVGSLLDSHADSTLDRQFLTIGAVTLDLGDQAPVWAGSLRRL